MNFTFFKKVGFYFSLASMITLVAAILSYTNGFTGNLLEYNDSDAVMKIALVGIGAFVVLLLLRVTSNYAPIVLWASSFASLLAYVNNIYMYFTGIFYNGVSLEAIALIDSAVINTTLLFVASFLLANIAMYTKHSTEKGRIKR